MSNGLDTAGNPYLLPECNVGADEVSSHAVEHFWGNGKFQYSISYPGDIMSDAKYRRNLGMELVHPDGKSSLDDCKSWTPTVLTEFVEKNGVIVGDAMVGISISSFNMSLKR